MRDLVHLAIHLLVMLAKFLRPGGVRAVAAESLALKHQLLICNRCRQRAPNLTTLDRLLLGLTTLSMRPHRIPKLIGTIRREYLDRMFFWNALDLDRKLQEFRDYYNNSRVHQSLSGSTPEEQAGKPRQTCAALGSFGWQQHCRGLFQTPVAA